MNRKFTLIIFLIFILTGIFLRFYNLRGNTPFNWDQENSIAYPAKEIIVGHHFPLIGPRTGVGDLRLGPFYSYLAALFFAIFKMDPIAGAILAGTLSFITLITGFLLVRKVFDFSTALYFALVYSSSTFIISLDRIPWNVNLFPLASILTASGLWLLLMNERRKGFFLTGLGIFLGINSHFSTLILTIVVVVFLLFNRKVIDRSIIIAVFFLVLALSPLLIFEVRHGFVLGKNLVKFTNESTVVIAKLIPRAVKISAITLELIGRLILFDGTRWIQQALALLFLSALFFLRKNSRIKLFIKVFVPYLSIYLFGYIFYSGATPEYYYLGLLSVAAIGAGLILSKIQENFLKSSVYLILLSSIILWRSFTLVIQTDTQSLGIKQQVVEKIKEVARNQPIVVVYDMELGHSYGYEYLFEFYEIKKIPKEASNSNNVYWISYPKKRFPGRPDYIYGDIALGLPTTSRKIFNTKEVEFYSHLFKLRIPKTWEVLQCPGIDFDKYLLTPNTTASCSTYGQERFGISIVNLPNCNIWEMEEKFDFKIGSELPFFIIPSDSLDNISNQINTDRVVVTAFERNRCVVFNDLEKRDQSQPSTEMITILENARK